MSAWFVTDVGKTLLLWCCCWDRCSVGARFSKLRETMASQRDSDSLVHAALVEIAWVHVAMFVMLGVCLMLLCAAGVRSEKQKGG